MNTQPEALLCAEALENDRNMVRRDKRAAAELRRLHEVNQELLEALTMLLSYTKACEGLLNCKPAGQIEIAEAAIAKATN